MEATCREAKAQGLERLGLFGTRFTMQARFYSDVFSKAGIVLIVPAADEQAYIHEKYMNELVNGIIRPETREQLLAVVDRLTVQERIQGLVLAGTELSLTLRDVTERDIPFLNTTEIHVNAAVAELLS